MKKTESFFRFDITQTTHVLLYKIEQGEGRRWLLGSGDSDNTLFLHELKRPKENFVLIEIGTGVLKFTTVHGFIYVVTDKDGDGAEVSFHGPVNALLTQSLLPRMTYVPETLVGMSSDMEDYVPIAEFMKLREQRHNGEVNPQDKFGWRVNMKFNNELTPWLPPFKGEMREKPKKKSGKFFRG